MHFVEHIIDSYDLRRREKLQFCAVQVFIADIEIQELTHAGGKPYVVLYCDMTEAELQKRL